MARLAHNPGIQEAEAEWSSLKSSLGYITKPCLTEARQGHVYAQLSTPPSQVLQEFQDQAQTARLLHPPGETLHFCCSVLRLNIAMTLTLGVSTPGSSQLLNQIGPWEQLQSCQGEAFLVIKCSQTPLPPASSIMECLSFCPNALRRGRRQKHSIPSCLCTGSWDCHKQTSLQALLCPQW